MQFRVRRRFTSMLGKETPCILPSRNPCSEVQPWLYVDEACEEAPQRAFANGTICSYPWLVATTKARCPGSPVPRRLVRPPNRPTCIGRAVSSRDPCSLICIKHIPNARPRRATATASSHGSAQAASGATGRQAYRRLRAPAIMFRQYRHHG